MDWFLYDKGLRHERVKNLFSKNDTVNKHIVLADDFNLNVLDFENNKDAQNFINFIFRYGTTTNKSTPVTANTTTAINHIITNVIVDTNFNTGILKNCISDHFARKKCYNSEQPIHMRIFNETSIESFRLRLQEFKWDNLKHLAAQI